MTDSNDRVESAKLEITTRAEQASERAAEAIRSAVAELKLEIEMLFAQARRNAAIAIDSPTASEDGAGRAAAHPINLNGESPPGWSSTESQSQPDVAAPHDESAAAWSVSETPCEPMLDSTPTGPSAGPTAR
jgi:hypothetical protein